MDVKWFTGKTLAIMSLFLCHLFILLNIVSTLVLFGNVFLAIELDLKSDFTWKTTEKAMTIVMVVSQCSQFCLTITKPFSPFYLKETTNYRRLIVSNTQLHNK